MENSNQNEWRQIMKKETFKGASNMGKTFATIGLIIVFIVFLILFYLGYQLIINRHTKEVNGNIVKVKCIYQDSMLKLYNCDIEIDYLVDEKKYTHKKQNYPFNKDLKEGENILLYHDPNDPSKIKMKKPDKILGYIIVTISIIMLILTIIFVSYIYTYEGLAYVSGISKVFLTH